MQLYCVLLAKNPFLVRQVPNCFIYMHRSDYVGGVTSGNHAQTASHFPAAAHDCLLHN
jgi:hypothetical protein